MTKVISAIVVDSSHWSKMKGKFLPISFLDEKPVQVRQSAVTLIEHIGSKTRLYVSEGWVDFLTKDLEKK